MTSGLFARAGARREQSRARVLHAASHRRVAMAVYNAEAAYRAASGVYTLNVAELLPYAPPHTLDGTCAEVPAIALTPVAFGCAGNGGYTAVVRGLGSPYFVATIRDDRFLQVNQQTSAAPF